MCLSFGKNSSEEQVKLPTLLLSAGPPSNVAPPSAVPNHLPSPFPAHTRGLVPFVNHPSPSSSLSPLLPFVECTHLELHLVGPVAVSQGEGRVQIAEEVGGFLDGGQ